MGDQELTHAIIGAAIEVHRQLGSSLLESACEECMARELALQPITFDRQKPLPLVYKDLKLGCGSRLDFLVDGRIAVELKAVEALAPIHCKILLTYLRLFGCKIGLLINFHCTAVKDGIRRRVLNNSR